ncbi:acyltransferase [Pseudomonas sp. R5(2019)]|uniref:acyltransferase family protein n=1 Tax=Pseudomonas sp. R5(2019) TaxID=2697566 RepID=UPI001412100C|nr:acyltransferase [Pseudomonas sp. R5(2019)]NBA98219.1 acyltransferase family protein [Pseudomonas sp. R5(2019)]
MSSLSTSALPPLTAINGPLHNSNIFDILRHIAALAVLFSHHFALNGLDEPKAFGVAKLGALSVVVFFSISGFLITQSYLRASSSIDYFKKRARRIFPALILCSFIMTAFVCTIFGSGEWSSYLLSKDAIYNFLHLSSLGSSATPEQMNYFSSTYIRKDALNGSLWTLFFEFFDYILIALFLFNKSRPIISLTVLLAGSILLQLAVQAGLTSNYWIDRSTILTIPFAIGGLLFITKKYWHNRKISLLLFALGVTGIMLAQPDDERSIIFFSSISILTIIIGSSFKDIIINGRFDISYGIYIYAYPTQQIMVNETGLGFWTSLAASALITVLLANMSWFFVEKKFIKKTIKTHAGV